MTNEVSLIKVRELSRNLSKEDRHTPHLQSGVKRIDDRWSKAQASLENRQKQLTAALESGPPKQFLSTMDAVLLKIKNMESQLGSEFLITDTASLEEQLQKYKVGTKCYFFMLLSSNFNDMILSARRLVRQKSPYHGRLILVKQAFDVYKKRICPSSLISVKSN